MEEGEGGGSKVGEVKVEEGEGRGSKVGEAKIGQDEGVGRRRWGSQRWKKVKVGR